MNATQSSTGDGVVLTLKHPGSQVGYTYTAVTATNDPYNSGSPSFSVSPTSGNLTAGATTTATTPIYSYSITDGSGNSGYAANSNIIAYNDSVNGQWSFAYDGLNRLSAGFTSAGVQANPYFCWSYDSFGNRTAQIASDEPFTSTLGSCQAATNADVSGSPASYDAQNRLTGALAPTYDAAGDVVLTDSAGYPTDTWPFEPVSC